jgi:V/A-type H+-transporting ATPase subunit D
MSAAPRISPTRSNLLRTRRRLGQVHKSIDVLKRKREALVAELFRLARPAADTRARIEEEAQLAYPALLRVLARHGISGTRSLGWRPRDIRVEMSAKQIWGIQVADILRRPPLRRTLAARGTAPGSTGPAAVDAADRFEDLTELLLDAAPREALIRRLGDALAGTSRQVHTLEQRLAPTLEYQITEMRRTLEEHEREEHLRLRHLLKGRHRRAWGVA